MNQCIGAAILVLVPAMAAASGVQAPSSAGRFNVLCIISDDLRPELGCYGADYIRSPNIDALADDLPREIRHAYYACISYVDAQVGRLLTALDKRNLRDNTVVARELYDHQADPDENRNLADLEEFADTAQRLSDQLGASWKAAAPPRAQSTTR